MGASSKRSRHASRMNAVRWAKVKKEEGAEEVLNMPQEPGPLFSVFNHNIPGDNIKINFVLVFSCGRVLVCP